MSVWASGDGWVSGGSSGGSFGGGSDGGVWRDTSSAGPSLSLSLSTAAHPAATQSHPGFFSNLLHSAGHFVEGTVGGLYDLSRDTVLGTFSKSYDKKWRQDLSGIAHGFVDKGTPTGELGRLIGSEASGNGAGGHAATLRHLLYTDPVGTVMGTAGLAIGGVGGLAGKLGDAAAAGRLGESAGALRVARAAGYVDATNEAQAAAERAYGAGTKEAGANRLGVVKGVREVGSERVRAAGGAPVKGVESNPVLRLRQKIVNDAMNRVLPESDRFKALHADTRGGKLAARAVSREQHAIRQRVLPRVQAAARKLPEHEQTAVVLRAAGADPTELAAAMRQHVAWRDVSNPTRIDAELEASRLAGPVAKAHAGEFSTRMKRALSAQVAGGQQSTALLHDLGVSTKDRELLLARRASGANLTMEHPTELEPSDDALRAQRAYKGQKAYRETRAADHEHDGDQYIQKAQGAVESRARALEAKARVLEDQPGGEISRLAEASRSFPNHDVPKDRLNETEEVPTRKAVKARQRLVEVERVKQAQRAMHEGQGRRHLGQAVKAEERRIAKLEEEATRPGTPTRKTERLMLQAKKAKESLDEGRFRGVEPRRLRDFGHRALTKVELLAKDTPAMERLRDDAKETERVPTARAKAARKQVLRHERLTNRRALSAQTRLRNATAERALEANRLRRAAENIRAKAERGELDQTPEARRHLNTARQRYQQALNLREDETKHMQRLRVRADGMQRRKLSEPMLEGGRSTDELNADGQQRTYVPLGKRPDPNRSPVIGGGAANRGQRVFNEPGRTVNMRHALGEALMNGQADLTHDALSRAMHGTFRTTEAHALHDAALRAAIPTELPEALRNDDVIVQRNLSREERAANAAGGGAAPITNQAASNFATMLRRIDDGTEDPAAASAILEKMQDGLVARTTDGRPITAEDVAQMSPDERAQYAAIPKRYFEGLLRDTNPPGHLVRTIHNVMRPWKTVMLPLTGRYFVNNAINSNVLLLLAQRGPGLATDYLDAARMLLKDRALQRDAAMSMVTDPAVHEIVPTLLDHMAGVRMGGFHSQFAPTSSDLARLSRGTRAMKVILGYPDRLNELGGALTDDLPRIVRFIQVMRPIVGDAARAAPEQFAGMTWHDAAAKMLTESAPLRNRVTETVMNDLVDFTHMSPVERELLVSAMPFYGWARGITKWYVQALLDHPLQVEGLHAVAGVQQRENQQAFGDVPDYMRMLVPIGDRHNGHQEAFNTHSLDPLGSLSDEGDLFQALGSGTPDQVASTLGGQISPLAGALYAAETGNDLFLQRPVTTPWNPENVNPATFGHSETTRLHGLEIPAADFLSGLPQVGLVSQLAGHGEPAAAAANAAYTPSSLDTALGYAGAPVKNVNLSAAQRKEMKLKLKGQG